MNILILLASDHNQEQRVNKEIATLSLHGHSITLVDLQNSVNARSDSRVKYIPIVLMSRPLPKTFFFWAVKYLEYFIRAFKICYVQRPDYIHCVDRLALIPGYCASLFSGVPSIYDSQEIWPEVSGSGNKPRALWLFLERFFAKRCKKVLVTDKFRKLITSRLLKVDPDKIVCMMNLPLRREITHACSDVRTDTNFLKDIILIYAGSISPNRHLEDILLSLCHLDANYKLVILGFRNQSYIDQLSNLAANNHLLERVKFVDAVRWNELSSYIRTANCSFALYEKNSINNFYCSPSKVFDSFLCGLPVVSTDNPLLIDISLHNCAVECIDIVNAESIAAAVNRLLLRFDSDQQKKDLIELAEREYTWENQEYLLLDLYSD